MFGFRKDKLTTIDSILKQSRLRIKLLELRTMQYSIIEETARCYLKSANIDYNQLEEHACFSIMIGAYIAMDEADNCGMITDSDENLSGFKLQFMCFLHNVIPNEEYQSIRMMLAKQQQETRIKDLRQMMKEKWHLTEFEAKIRTLALNVACIASPDESHTRDIENALYDFYLKAADNYFQEDN